MILLAGLTLVSSVLVHELGHVIAYITLTGKLVMPRFKKYKVLIGTPADYKEVSISKQLIIYLAGIILGTIPFIITYQHNVFMHVAMLAYLGLCIHDIQRIGELTR